MFSAGNIVFLDAPNHGVVLTEQWSLICMGNIWRLSASFMYLNILKFEFLWKGLLVCAF